MLFKADIDTNEKKIWGEWQKWKKNIWAKHHQDLWFNIYFDVAHLTGPYFYKCPYHYLNAYEVMKFDLSIATMFPVLFIQLACKQLVMLANKL